MAEPLGKCRTRCAVCGCGPGTSAVHHDVGGTGQIEQPYPVGFVGGIQHRAAFVRVVQHECDARSLHRRRRVSGAAAAGRLDLQHVGAEIGEDAADPVGFGAAEIEHSKRREQSVAHRADNRSTHSRWASVSSAT